MFRNIVFNVKLLPLKITLFLFLSLIFTVGFSTFFSLPVQAADNLYLGTIISINKESCISNEDSLCENAEVLLGLDNNVQSTETVQLKQINSEVQDISANYQIGDKIQVKQTILPNNKSYYQAIAVDSGNLIVYFTILIVLMVVVISRWKGLKAVLALALTTWFLFGWLLPFFQKNPDQILGTGILACFGFLFVNFMLGHGWNVASWVALASSAFSFVVSIFVSLFVASIFRLNGLGSDGSVFLASVGFTTPQLTDLFLIGTFLAVTGALDDVTSAQAVSIKEISSMGNGASFIELYKHGTKVGQEHLVSMINTLILAFVGASLPTFMVLYLQNQTNIWFLLSREDVLEEIVRSLLASFTLVLAIPLTTVLASYVFSRANKNKKQDESQVASTNLSF